MERWERKIKQKFVDKILDFMYNIIIKVDILKLLYDYKIYEKSTKIF